MKLELAAFVGACLVLSGSLALARKGPASKPYARLSQAPEAARARANPLRESPATVDAGKKLFERHCQECHGVAGERGEKGPSLRAQEVQTASEGSLFWALTNGAVRSGMPAWSKLPEPQRWQIVTYVKSLGPSDAPPQPLRRSSKHALDLPALEIPQRGGERIDLVTGVVERQ